MNHYSHGVRSFAALAALALLAAYPLRQKMLQQRAERSIEACVSYQETLDLLKSDPASVPNFLERCRLMGVKSAALREETLRDWAEQGRATFLTRAESEKFRALGLGSDLPKTESLWTRDAASAETLLSALVARYPAFAGKMKPKRIGGYFFIDRPEGLWEKDLDLRLGLNPEAVQRLGEIGLAIVFAIEEQGKSALPDSTRLGTQVSSSAAASAWLITGVPESAARKSAMSPAFADSLCSSNAPIVLLENVNVPLVHRLAADLGVASRVVKGHTVTVDEMKAQSPEIVSQRYVRAVTERSVRFIYFHWNPDASGAENLNTLRSVMQGVKSRGCGFDGVPKNSIVVSWPAKPFRMLAAFLIAVAAPWAAMRLLLAFLKRPENQGKFPIEAWFAAGAAALMGGLIINLLLPDSIFAGGLASFKGVKASMVLPLVLIGTTLFTAEDFSGFLRRKAAVRDLLIFAVCTGALLFMLKRSGNFSGGVHPMEITFRNGIETLLGVRPRFKEFAIGHPLLILGLALWPAHRTLSKLCLWAGAVAWISILNTFCHLHTPVQVSLIRTLNGFILGGVAGLALAALFRALEKRPDFARALAVFEHES